jgi:hypothetical protein
MPGCATIIRPTLEPGPDAGRKARLVGDLRQRQGGQRRLARRLEDHRIAAGQGRRDFPDRQEQRKIPGNDRGDHADRLAQRVGEVLARRGDRGDRDGGALDLRRPAGHVAEEVGAERHVGGARDRQRLAVVERLEHRELFEVLEHQVAQLVNDLAALTVRHLAPGRTVLERRARSAYRPVGVLGLAVRDRGENLLGGGVDAVERLARRRVHPLTVDQHLAAQRAHDLLDAWRVERQSHR